QRRRAAGRVGGGDGAGRVVGAQVLDAADLPSVEVGVEQVAAGGGGLQGDRGGVGVHHERLDGGGVGQAVAASRHEPDAVARVVAEEQRAVVGPGVGAAGVEADGGDHRAVVQRAAVAGDHRDAVLVGVVRAGRGAGGVEVLADVEVGGVVAGLAPDALVARPAEVHRRGGR